MRKWNTTATVTNTQGQTGTATTPVCADTEIDAATGITNRLNNQGYTTDGKITVQPAGHCDHQH